MKETEKTLVAEVGNDGVTVQRVILFKNTGAVSFKTFDIRGRVTKSHLLVKLGFASKALRKVLFAQVVEFVKAGHFDEKAVQLDEAEQDAEDKAAFYQK